jgi:membrane-bound lytic murein transglycosylase D
LNNELLSSMPYSEEIQIGARPTLSSVEIHYDLPIIQNLFVDRHIAFFQTTFKERFEQGLSRSGRYLPMMQETLASMNLPKDLVYVALIESNFNVKATSRAKAVGPWQFIKGTGRRYGLRIDNWIDERRDPEKSTRAAANYLKDLYELFDSWPLAMASYNAGEGRVMRAMARTQAGDFWTLNELGALPRETRNYVPKFMAATMIAKNPEGYGFSVSYEVPVLYDEVEIWRPTSLQRVARAVGVSVDELKFYNPEIKKERTPPNYPGYRLKLPPGKKETFLEHFPRTKEVESVRVVRARGTARIKVTGKEGFAVKSRFDPSHQTHRVRKGETIDSISRKYGVSMKRILKANRLRKNSVIYAGRSLVIPRT